MGEYFLGPWRRIGHEKFWRSFRHGSNALKPNRYFVADLADFDIQDEETKWYSYLRTLPLGTDEMPNNRGKTTHFWPLLQLFRSRWELTKGFFRSFQRKFSNSDSYTKEVVDNILP